jgi:hypothetical protein
MHVIAGPGLNRINRLLIPISCNLFFFRSLSPKNSEVNLVWPRAISGWVTDQKVLFGVCTSKDKLCRKDWCWSVRVVYVLENLLGPTSKRQDVT